MDGVNLTEQIFAVNTVKTSNRVSDSKSDVLFSDYMAKPVFDDKKSVKIDAAKDSETEYQQYKYKKKDIEPSDKTPEEMKLDEISEDIEKLEEDLVETVSEDLNVDKEQLIEVMEYLGLAPIDLIEQENLAKLAIELNVSTDSTELLFNENFQQLLSDVNEIVSQTASNLGIPYDEMAELISQMDVIESQDEGIDIATIVKDFTDADIQNQNADVSAGDQGAVLSNEDVDTDIQNQNADVSAGNQGAVLSNEDADADIQNQNADVSAGDQGAVLSNEDADAYSGLASEEEIKTVTNNSESVSDESVLNFEKVGIDNSETASDTYSNSDGENNAHGNLDNGASVMAHSPEVNSIFNLDEGGINDIQKSFVSSETTELINQIAENVKLSISQSATSIEMQLNPENLGKVYVNLSSKEGVVNAQFVATNEIVREAIEAQMVTLKENLNQAGVKVDAVEVTVSSHEFEKNLEQDQSRQEQEGQYQEEMSGHRRRSINLSSLDELSGVMSEEEALLTQIMKDNGNSVDLTV